MSVILINNADSLYHEKNFSSIYTSQASSPLDDPPLPPLLPPAAAAALRRWPMICVAA